MFLVLFFRLFNSRLYRHYNHLSNNPSPIINIKNTVDDEPAHNSVQTKQVMCEQLVIRRKEKEPSIQLDIPDISTQLNDIQHYRNSNQKIVFTDHSNPISNEKHVENRKLNNYNVNISGNSNKKFYKTLLNSNINNAKSLNNEDSNKDNNGNQKVKNKISKRFKFIKNNTPTILDFKRSNKKDEKQIVKEEEIIDDLDVDKHFASHQQPKNSRSYNLNESKLNESSKSRTDKSNLRKNCKIS